MVGLQIFLQEIGGVALSSGVTDEDDLIRGSDVFRDVLVKRVFFGHAFALVVSFLAMNQMMMEMERIVRSNLLFVRRTTSTEILVNMGGVMVDDDDHTTRLSSLRLRTWLHTGFGFFQEFTQARNFLFTKIMSLRPLEEGALAADAKDKFVVSMWLNLT